MQTRLAALAAAAVLLSTTGARADYVVSIPGTFSFVGSSGVTVTTPALSGSLQGVRVSFTYEGPVGSSTAYDVAFTVGESQWGGYYPLLNGAAWGEAPTGAPSTGSALTFVSGNLAMGYSVAFDNQSAVVGFGNGNAGGGCTLSNVTITLLGVVPAPGAAGLLLVGGPVVLRRKRRVS
ncbi:MAG: hypothetical protein K2Q09_06910 [Phycisphaerales bacterium]|nr:hypothetical protein [Phycisphaerales bacterium]